MFYCTVNVLYLRHFSKLIIVTVRHTPVAVSLFPNRLDLPVSTFKSKEAGCYV